VSGLSLSSPPIGEGLISLDPPALLGGACRDCGARCFPARSVCPSCQSRAVEETALSSIGIVYTFTIVAAPPPGYLGEVPYGLGVVELPDGIRVTTMLTAADLGSLAIGDEVEFELIELGAEDERVVSFAFRKPGEGG
jgi:uncharacterized protein